MSGSGLITLSHGRYRLVSHERGKAQIVNDYDKRNISVVNWDIVVQENFHFLFPGESKKNPQESDTLICTSHGKVL
jgi:hypothetical protein